MLVELAIRNVLRHRGRTLMTLVAIATGVAALIVSGGFVQNLYRQLGESIIHSQSGHLQVARAEYFGAGSRSPEKQRIPDLAAIKATLAGLRGVEHVMARLNFSGLLSNSRTDLPVFVEGIEPQGEAELSSSLEIVKGQFLGSQNRTGVLIGEGLANSLGLAPGSAVTLLANTLEGAVNTTELEVIGVFRSFSRDYDARAVKMPLSAAQEVLAVDDANTIVLLLNDTGLTDRVRVEAERAMLSNGLVVKDWRELNDFYTSTVNLYERQFGVLKAIILFLVALGVSNSVTMAVMERMAEFGTMRALGNRGLHVIKLIMLESVVVGVAGALMGATLGVTLALAISAIGIAMPPPPNSNIGYVATIELSVSITAQAIGIGIAATVLAACIPALRARRIEVVDALRTSI